MAAAKASRTSADFVWSDSAGSVAVATRPKTIASHNTNAAVKAAPLTRSTCARTAAGPWSRPSWARYLHPQPGRRLEPCDIALAPLTPGQQAGRFSRRHPEGHTDRRRLDDALVGQFLAD